MKYLIKKMKKSKNKALIKVSLRYKTRKKKMKLTQILPLKMRATITVSTVR